MYKQEIAKNAHSVLIHMVWVLLGAMAECAERTHTHTSPVPSAVAGAERTAWYRMFGHAHKFLGKRPVIFAVSANGIDCVRIAQSRSLKGE